MSTRSWPGGLAGRGAQEIPLALAHRLRRGRHLAQECTGCHRIDGTNTGIPSIAGWDAERFVRTLAFYRTGERTNPVMVSVVKSLDETQVRALAAYYASLPKK